MPPLFYSLGAGPVPLPRGFGAEKTAFLTDPLMYRVSHTFFFTYNPVLGLTI